MYQIDKSFTRLAPAIDFSNVVLEGTDPGWCLLGSPPQRLLDVHCPALIHAWHERLAHALAHPTQVETHKGHRRVQVMGNAIFNFDARGQVHLWLWAFNGDDLPALERLPDHTVVAVDVPYQDLWMKGYAGGALRSLSAMHPGQAELCLDYVAWAAGALNELCWTPEVQDQVRTNIKEALALDAKVLELASQIQLSARPRLPLRLEQYNHVLTRQTVYLKLEKEAPQFISLYALLADEVHLRFEPTYAMKYCLREQGLGTAVWRLLARTGTQWINEFLPFFDLQRQPLYSCAIEIVKMAAAFGTQALAPKVALHALMQIGGNPNMPSAYYVDRIDDQFALCKRLGVIAGRADAATQELLRDEFPAIFQWGTYHAQEVPDTVMRRITLKGLLRKVQAQALLDQKRHASGPVWSVPYRLELDDPQVKPIILDSALAVWQEGQLMHHCADNYLPQCESGALLMVSLRDANHRRPLATVSFSITTSQVKIHKFSGFANQRISDRAQHLIEQCLRELQRQHRRVRQSTKPRMPHRSKSVSDQKVSHTAS